MKSITYEEFLLFNPCYLNDETKKALMDSIAKRQKRWTALDILGLEEIPDEDRVWAVLHEKLIDPRTHQEFACRCAERALSYTADPDPRSIAAVAAKRAWLRGEITYKELENARDAAKAAMRQAERSSMRAAIRAATATSEWLASMSGAADEEARGAVRKAREAAALAAMREAAATSAWLASMSGATDTEARYVARETRLASIRAAAFDSAWESERGWQVEELKAMLKEEEA